EEGGRRMRGLFNPLLIAEGTKPVPCDLEGDRFDTIHILTGPNSGGKTRLLQTIGITQLLAQGGFFVPAAEARLRPASGLFVSLVGISEPRPELGEGRLGTELIRIRRMFETSKPEALVILDEFCSGTNPSEGEEIFYLVLTLLGELRPEVFISTHFLEFTRRLSKESSPLNLAYLQVELDESQRPTYGVGQGVAITSLAAQTAARLGVTREELMALIQKNRR
ncbi:MAG: DNA mismatch repair protein, partial [Polyangia bacterium]|nr:DNA mismatch repair protein [Polyangia bacterium]